MTATARSHARSLVLTLVVALTLGVLSTAHAQSFEAFTGPLFEDLWADDFDCVEFGLADADLYRCGLIDDNLVDTNKSIIARHVNRWGMTVAIPWRANYLENGTLNHQYGAVGGNGWSYVISYVELDADKSFVWVAAIRQ